MTWTAPCPNCGQNVKWWTLGNSPTHTHATPGNKCPNKQAVARPVDDHRRHQRPWRP